MTEECALDFFCVPGCEVFYDTAVFVSGAEDEHGEPDATLGGGGGEVGFVLGCGGEEF